ncbi:unnamed protein product [Paramecium pentaurelia]|uniref:Uncharacterized protein n=1 Tax=Paramecium pentaurelia TaxID=43138 RepID=A0A8S1XHY0_9CILI|nr:unnamed protein product [Paramecium pentaurelia]
MQEVFECGYSSFHPIADEAQDSNCPYDQNSYRPAIFEMKESEQIIKQNFITNHQQQSNQLYKNFENNQTRIDYKNLPKLIGNHYYKYIEQNNITKTKGVENFYNSRKIKKDKGNKKAKQISTTISDLREICKADNQSKTTFKRFIKKQLFIDLIHSPKIEDPLKYLDGISTYYAAADEPDKMISSHLLSSKNETLKK